jgi:hypothetical protein
MQHFGKFQILMKTFMPSHDRIIEFCLYLDPLYLCCGVRCLLLLEGFQILKMFGLYVVLFLINIIKLANMQPIGEVLLK